MSDLPSPTLSERLRLRNRDPFPGAVLLTWGAIFAVMGAVSCVNLVVGLPRATDPSELWARFAVSFIGNAVIGLVLTHAVYWPSVLFADWLASIYLRRGRRTEAVLVMVLLAIVCQAFMHGGNQLFAWLVPDTATMPGPLSVVVAGLILWLVLLPFQALFWWAVQAGRLGYSIPQIFNWWNAVEQWQTLFERSSQRKEEELA